MDASALASAQRGTKLEPGTFCWSQLITTDLKASKAFYKAVFGWAAADQGPPGEPPASTEWKLGGSVLMGPTDIEPGRFAVISDDVGGVFSVIALKG